MYSTSAYAVFIVSAVTAVLFIVCIFMSISLIFLLLFFSFNQILMSVHLVLIIAYRSVLIMMVGSVAAVMKDIDWGMIGSAVKVRGRERERELSKEFDYFSLDIDECVEMTDNCEQTCTNTLGSYQCSCLSKWILRNGNNCTAAGQFHY